MSQSLTSIDTRVESPFIVITIGDYTLGGCTNSAGISRMKGTMKVTYPDFMKSIKIVKINGAVNTYTIILEYGIASGDDPNLIDRILGSVQNNREIKISYGDWNAPSYIYKDELAIITKITERVDVASSKITYELRCTSSSITLKAGTFNFNAKVCKPSDELMRIVNNAVYRIKDIFPGMRQSTDGLAGFIAADDQVVQIEAQKSTNVLDYMMYLTNCMKPISEKVSDTLKKAYYQMTIYDDVTNEHGGQYFKVQKVSPDVKSIPSYDTYVVDVGYPSDNFVTNFTINNNEAWSILYEHANKIELPQYTYSIDNDGNVISTYSPSVATSSKKLKATEANQTWWTKVTEFPITAQLTIKGLLRPAMLMTYVRVNVYFYGRKHISSGLYIITKQEDTIDGNGYKTTLSLTRIGGDE